MSVFAVGHTGFLLDLRAVGSGDALDRSSRTRVRTAARPTCSPTQLLSPSYGKTGRTLGVCVCVCVCVREREREREREK